jgi:hypothetical protein
MSFITVVIAKYNYNDQVMEDEMGRACSMHGEKRWKTRRKKTTKKT